MSSSSPPLVRGQNFSFLHTEPFYCQAAKCPSFFRLLPLWVHVSSSGISLQEGTCSWETFADFPGDDFWSCSPHSRFDSGYTSPYVSPRILEKSRFSTSKWTADPEDDSSLRLLVLVRLRSTGSRFFPRNDFCRRFRCCTFAWLVC